MSLLPLLLSLSAAWADEYAFFGTGSVKPVLFCYASGFCIPDDQYWLERITDSTELEDCSIPYARDYYTEFNEDHNDTTSFDTVWPHALWYRGDEDMLYAAMIYSNQLRMLTLKNVPEPASGTSVTDDVGSVGVFDSPRSMSSGQTPDRELAGPTTGLDMPHAVAVDAFGDLLYVANTQNGGTETGEILVFENASTLDGDIAWSWDIDSQIDHPVDVHYDLTTDTLTVVNFNPGSPPEVLLFKDISYRLATFGAADLDIKMTFSGVTGFIHETWYWGEYDTLYFTTRGRYLSIKDMSPYLGYPAPGCNSAGTGSCPADCTWVPAQSYLDCTGIADDAHLDLTGSASPLGGYGLYIDEAHEVLWALVSYDNNAGNERLLKYPDATNLISSSSPDREVCWDPADGSTYHINQGLWVITE